MKGLFLLRDELFKSYNKAKFDLDCFNINMHHIMIFDIGDIIINKNPYRGECPKKIVSFDKDSVYCVTLDDSLEWESDFREALSYDSFEYYEKIYDYDKWLQDNKQDILDKWTEWEYRSSK